MAGQPGETDRPRDEVGGNLSKRWAPEVPELQISDRLLIRVSRSGICCLPLG